MARSAERRDRTSTAVDRLLSHLLPASAPGDLLAEELAAWLAGSPRFRAFAEAHRDKIRKKLRGATDADARRDVRAELRVAHLLLADRRTELAFEAYGSSVGGPDFTVTFRGHRPFNVEVTRPRRAADATAAGSTLLAKLRQLPPSVANVLVAAVDGPSATAFDVAAAVRALRVRADAKDEAFFASRGLEGTRRFYERFMRLGAVLAWAEAATGDDRVSTWRNRSARIAVPERALRACVAAMRAAASDS